MMPNRSTSAAVLAMECLRDTAEEALLAEVMPLIVVREAGNIKIGETGLYKERHAQQRAEDHGLRQFAEAELVHIERTRSPDEPQRPAKQHGHEGHCHGGREKSEPAGGKDYPDETDLAQTEMAIPVSSSRPG